MDGDGARDGGGGGGLGQGPGRRARRESGSVVVVVVVAVVVVVIVVCRQRGRQRRRDHLGSSSDSRDEAALFSCFCGWCCGSCRGRVEGLGRGSVGRGRRSSSDRSRSGSRSGSSSSSLRRLSHHLLPFFSALLAGHPHHADPVRPAPGRSQEPAQRQAQEPPDLGVSRQAEDVAWRSRGPLLPLAASSFCPTSGAELHLTQRVKGPRGRPRVRQLDDARGRARVGEAEPDDERMLAGMRELERRLCRGPGAVRVAGPGPRGLRGGVVSCYCCCCCWCERGADAAGTSRDRRRRSLCRRGKSRRARDGDEAACRRSARSRGFHDGTDEPRRPASGRDGPDGRGLAGAGRVL